MKITDEMRIALERAMIDSGRETDAMIAAIAPLILGDHELQLDKLLDELAAEKEISRVLRSENERLRLSIMGGEDAPGHAASIPVGDLIASFEQEQRDLSAYYERLDALAENESGADLSTNPAENVYTPSGTLVPPA